MLLTIASFILVLGVLIFVHELGHFMAAKAMGIGVPRFSIGLGPITPLSFRHGETEYVISWIPFGGYVKMASQEEQGELDALEGGETPESFPPEKLFENKSVAARILVISAGVIMNAVFAWAAYSWLAYSVGQTKDPTTRVAKVDAEVLPQGAESLKEIPFGAEIVRVNGQEVTTWSDITDGILDPSSADLSFDFADGSSVTVPGLGADINTRVKIAGAIAPLWEARAGAVLEDRPAAQAGLETGDLITAIDGVEIASWTAMVRIVEKSAGQELRLSIDRDGEQLEIPVTPFEETVKDPSSGEERQVGRIGIGPHRIRVRYDGSEALVEGWRQAVRDGSLVFFTLKGMFVGQVSARELGGPILIGQVSGQVARRGWAPLLSFMAFLSINLAILNLLPIPVLDGGHLVFLIAEGVRRRPLSRDLRLRLTQVGFYFLLALMLFVIVNDVLRKVG